MFIWEKLEKILKSTTLNVFIWASLSLRGFSVEPPNTFNENIGMILKTSQNRPKLYKFVYYILILGCKESFYSYADNGYVLCLSVFVFLSLYLYLCISFHRYDDNGYAARGRLFPDCRREDGDAVGHLHTCHSSCIHSKQRKM